VPVVHVEAGMRSHDRTMPEELNRVLTDHMSALLLCSSEAAAANLRAESAAGRVEVVGDVMVDVAMRRQFLARTDDQSSPRTDDQSSACTDDQSSACTDDQSSARTDDQSSARTDERILATHGVRGGEYLVLTAHRAGNVDEPARLRALVDLVAALPAPVVFPLHPRTRARLQDAGLVGHLQRIDGLRLTEPLGYVEFSALLCRARAVLTDSGGVQKEAYLAGVPCVTLRANTEWVETVQAGWNTLVDLDAGAALTALQRVPPTERPALYGDGHAAERCVQAIGTLA
jgi:UDP-GlcNAc3NAcA epimerase